MVRRFLAAALLLVLGSVQGAGTLHVHSHIGPAVAAPGWYAPEESSDQGPSSCLLCRFAQQSVTAAAVLAHAGRPVTLPVSLETGIAEEPRQTACTSALPRAPPAAFPIS